MIYLLKHIINLVGKKMKTKYLKWLFFVVLCNSLFQICISYWLGNWI